MSLLKWFPAPPTGLKSLAQFRPRLAATVWWSGGRGLPATVSPGMGLGESPAHPINWRGAGADESTMKRLKWRERKSTGGAS